ncbi:MULTISPECIES: NfeD family protein [Clostridium]|uniref:NfeD family protein n=1 Tax=Clostridium TaxID=1485 RepID=UPI0008240BA6|nr:MULTISPECIES: NfeD family protein [Clostridium]PJI07200.1 NfeD family protein [Clostridium sp. CT7]
MNDVLKIWIAIGVVMMLIDFTTSGFLFIWFTIGAVAAIVASLLGASLTIQIIIFLVVSIICLSVGYPLSKKLIKSTVRRTPLMEEKFIGREIKANKDMDIGNSKIKLDGIYWTVKNVGENIREGESFIITGIDGNKLLIRKKGDV